MNGPILCLTKISTLKIHFHKNKFNGKYCLLNVGKILYMFYVCEILTKKIKRLNKS